MFSFFYVWSKALAHQQRRLHGRPAERERGRETRRLDYCVLELRPSAQLRDQRHLPAADSRRTASPATLLNDWQLSGVYRWTSGRPYASATRSRASAMPTSPATTATRGAHRADLRSRASGYGSDPYKQFNTGCFAPPQPGSDGAESARFFMRLPADQQPRHVALEAVQRRQATKFEFRLDAFNALNHTQFTGVNAHGELREPDRPRHHEPRFRGQQERLRDNQRRGQPEDAATRRAVHVLGCPLVDSLRGRTFGSGPFFCAD